MEIRKSKMMAAIEDRARKLDEHIGATVLVRDLVGNLVNPFTREVFRIGAEIETTFDGFLRGQLLANRISVTTLDGQPISAPYPKEPAAEAAPVKGEEPPPAPVDETKGEPPADDPQPGAPTEGAAPEQGAEQPAAEAPPAPAAKSSILKKPAAA